MERFRNLLVGLTRTERDVDLIRYAAMVARLNTAIEIRFVHVLPRPVAGQENASHGDAQEHLERQVEEFFLNVPDSARVYCHVLKGPLLDRMLAFVAEQEIDLIVIGHQTERPTARSLVRRLAMKAPCSVWIVPEKCRIRIQKILVPVDFSESAADALLVATSLSRLFGGVECIPLHIHFNDAVLTYEEDDPIVRGQEENAYKRFVAPIDCRDVPMTPMFLERINVATAIHEVALEHSVDLKVISTRGRSRSAAILLGSVAEGVITEARTPVLVVKHFGARLGLLQLLLDRTFRRSRSPRFD